MIKETLGKLEKLSARDIFAHEAHMTDYEELMNLYYQKIKPRYAHVSRMLADFDLGVDLDADPFAPCEQELLDRPLVKEFPVDNEGSA